MLKFIKRPNAGVEYGVPLTLRVPGEKLSRAFDTATVNTFRHMATELECNSGLPARTAFMSALSGEGVTYTAMAFGTTLATDTAERVCVVELNWWFPGMFSQLSSGGSTQTKRRGRERKASQPEASMSARPGLAQVLSGDATLNDALIATEQPNLSLLPAGDLPIARRPAVARSAALRELLEQLSERYSRLVLDLPAILVTSDAIALAALSDACILVVRHGITPSASVKRALDDIRNERMLGVVLNQVALKTPRWITSLIPQE
jgi:Mrp family chromosome partitioning ATPase